MEESLEEVNSLVQNKAVDSEARKLHKEIWLTTREALKQLKSDG